MSETYQSSLAYLYGLQKHGIKLGLDTIRILLGQCQHPERKFAVLHIGGTNGKGSAAAMTAAILRAANIRVGLFTSPHLIDFRERIQVQGEPIAEHRVVDLVERFRRFTTPTASPTFFETTTAMAFQYFAEERVEIAVVEVGLGGRFDATNVCQPMGTLVTNVALDHEAYLGETLGAIAFEKAGIIKERIPLVVGPMPDEAHAVIRQRAYEQHAPLCQFGSDFTIHLQDSGLFEYQSSTHHYPNLPCALKGAHQFINAACALALLEASVMPHHPLSQEAIVKGLSSVSWGGRLETLMTDPLMICDGAHNPDAGRALRHYVADTIRDVPGRKVIVILGMMKDKNIERFLAELLPIADAIICTQIDHPRSVTALELQERLISCPKPVYAVSLPADAVCLAKQLSHSQDLICITGSLFLIGAIKSVLAGSPYAPIVG